MRAHVFQKFPMTRFKRFHTLYFWPLIIAGARLGIRVVLNLWQMIES